MRFFRVQSKSIPFESMKTFNSADGGDGASEGLAACSTPSGIEGGSRFGGAWDAAEDDDEVVIFEGVPLQRIYDGWRVRPVREIARFTVREWAEMLRDGSAWDWEE